jgi:hypothetical protein
VPRNLPGRPTILFLNRGGTSSSKSSSLFGIQDPNKFALRVLREIETKLREWVEKHEGGVHWLSSADEIEKKLEEFRKKLEKSIEKFGVRCIQNREICD